jgi:hypothetical protein
MNMKRKIQVDISEDAKSLLMSAGKGGGRILYMRLANGTAIQTNDKVFFDDGECSTEGRWAMVVRELREQGLVALVGVEGTAFEITRRGCDFCEELEAAAMADGKQ